MQCGAEKKNRCQLEGECETTGALGIRTGNVRWGAVSWRMTREFGEINETRTYAP